MGYNVTMHLKIDGLAHLDPSAAPLPHGTEVCTRVAREHAGRRVPEGTVGRVLAHHDGAFDVAIVGVGTLRFERAELVPRRVGQVLFARRRETHWAALRPCAVLEAVVGSRAWGLDDHGSDTDRRGVFALPLRWRTGLIEAPEDLVSADSSESLWSVEKTVRQALRADPNTLELLFADSVRALDPIGAWLLEAREAFVSIEIYGTFARYALAQLRRLEQGLRLVDHRAHVIEWLRAEPDLTLDRIAERLASITPRAAPDHASALASARQWAKQLYRSMHDQGLIERADLDALRAFARDRAEGLELPRELRPKNAYNLLRLLYTATDWLRTGAPALRVAPGPRRERLLAIKRGEVALEDVLAEAEAIAPELEAARDASPLPRRADIARADALLRRIGDEIARRHVFAEPGPLGAGAPEPPEAAWTD